MGKTGRCVSSCFLAIGAILAAMLDLAQVRTLLLAERSRDVGVITEAVDAVLATSPKRARSISKWCSAMPARPSI